MMYAKNPRQRNPHLLDMAQGQKCLMLAVHNCQTVYGATTVAAHKNEGKGKGVKQHDYFTVWACEPCHTWYDQSGAPLAEKRRAFNAAHDRQKAEWRKIEESYSSKEKDQKAARWALDQLEVKMNEVMLPWPPKELNPNVKTHWAKKAAIAKKYKHACWALTKEAGLVVPDSERIAMLLDFYPPDRRARDDDNIIASFKHGRDGVALALGIDDKRFRLMLYVQEEKIGGYVRLQLTDMPKVG